MVYTYSTRRATGVEWREVLGDVAEGSSPLDIWNITREVVAMDNESSKAEERRRTVALMTSLTKGDSMTSQMTS